MKNIRLTARKVGDECDYLPLKRLGLSAEWLVKSGSGAASDPWIYTLTVCNAGTSPWKGVIRLSLPFVSKAPPVLPARVHVRHQSGRSAPGFGQQDAAASARAYRISGFTLVDHPQRSLVPSRGVGLHRQSGDWAVRLAVYGAREGRAAGLAAWRGGGIRPVRGLWVRHRPVRGLLYPRL